MNKVKVYITLKESVLDPQGNTVKDSLHHLAYTNVEDVRIGKYIELLVSKTATDIESQVKEMCEKLLANVVIEDFRYEVEEVKA